MLTLTLDSDELRALCELLTDVTRQPSKFRCSPKRGAWLSALEELMRAMVEEEWRVKDPTSTTPRP